MEAERKKRSQEEEPPVAGWQTIYCSLALILVAFFAMLVSYSNIETQKVKVFKEGREMMEAGEILSGNSIMMLSRDRAREMEENIEKALGSLGNYFKEAGLGDSVELIRVNGGFKVTFESNLLFPSGEAVIRKEAYEGLNKMAQAAGEDRFSIRVEGHTDNMPIQTPLFPSNWELSTTRAVNVLRYLVETCGIHKERLSAAGCSQYRPVVSNETPKGRQKNRRVEFYFKARNVKKASL